MPPHTDVTIDLPKLYYSDGDGNYVPFTGIQEAVFELEIEHDPNIDIVVPSFSQTGELRVSLTMTPASSKRWRKSFHAFSNKIRRTIRTCKRQKEKERRRRLKHEARICSNIR